MTTRYDIRFDKTYINANNDIEVFASDMAHVKSIINANAGDFKETPTLGVGANNYLLGSGVEQDIARKIIIQLRGDGYTCDRPSVTFDSNGKLTINPNVIL